MNAIAAGIKEGQDYIRQIDEQEKALESQLDLTSEGEVEGKSEDKSSARRTVFMANNSMRYNLGTGSEASEQTLIGPTSPQL